MATLFVVGGLPVGLDHITARPAAALARQVFEHGTLVKPGPGYDAIASQVTVERDIAVPAAGAPDAVLDIYRPRSASAPEPVILWIHGGGYLSGSRRQVAVYATMLAAQGFTVGSLEYSLAPAHRYPTPVRQGIAALAYLATNASRHGGDPARLAVGGDSAGAQIASQLAATQADPSFAAKVGVAHVANLRAVVLFCGLYDMDTVGSSGFPALRTVLWSYTGHRDWTSYPRIDELSTTRHVSTAFPPTYLSVGNIDPFRSQATELESALGANGIPTTTLYWEGAGVRLGHEYQFDFRTPQARAAFTSTVTFLHRQLRTQS